MSRLFYTILFIFLLFIMSGCSNEDAKPNPISKTKQSEERIERIEKQVEEDETIYKVKVEQPGSSIQYDGEAMEETLNPIAIFEITESKDGKVSSTLLETSFLSNDDLVISKPQEWTTVDERVNTYLQYFKVQSNKNKEYHISGSVTYTVVSPTDLMVNVEY